MPTVKVSGVELYYEEAGQGFPLILLHGGWADGSVWQAQVPAFSAKYRVLAYDRRGCGRSQKEGVEHSAALWTEDLYQLMRALGIAQAHLAGTSYGGMIVLEFLLRHQGMARSAVLISTTSEGYVSPSEPKVPFGRRTPELGRITVPVLVVQGANDTSFPPAIGEIIHRGIAGSEFVVVAECGHRVQSEKPEDLNAAMLRFLERVDAA